MTKETCLEFLELPKNATDEAIVSRFKEKYNFFKMLHTNAPNQIIRNLQQKNLDILEEIKSVLPVVPTSNSREDEPSLKTKSKENKIEIEKSSNSEDIIAWLIVHTEEKEVKSFPLFEGINAIGRQKHSRYHSVEIGEDTFISRVHCFVNIVRSSFNFSAAILDDGKYSEGKKSLNGTYINGKDKRINSQIIEEGDTIQVGMTKLVFKWNSTSIREIEDDVALSDFVGTIVINL